RHYQRQAFRMVAGMPRTGTEDFGKFGTVVFESHDFQTGFLLVDFQVHGNVFAVGHPGHVMAAFGILVGRDGAADVRTVRPEGDHGHLSAASVFRIEKHAGHDPRALGIPHRLKTIDLVVFRIVNPHG